jgi:hypothetical protein
VCLDEVYAGGPQPVRIAGHAHGPAFLRRCEACGTYREETLRYVAPITPMEARELYPAFFGGAR